MHEVQEHKNSGVAYKKGVWKDPSVPLEQRPLVLYCHATGFCKEVWDACITQAVLSSASAPPHDFVSLDFRGHGNSAALKGEDWPPRWEDFCVKDIMLVIESEGGLDRPVYGVGHSMGASGLVLTALSESASRGKEGPLFCGLLLFEPMFMESKGQAEPLLERLISQAKRRRRRWRDHDELRDYLRPKHNFRSWHVDALEGYIRGGFRRRCGGSIPGLARCVELKCDPNTEAYMYLGRCGPEAFSELPRLPERSLKVCIVVGDASNHTSGPWGDAVAYLRKLETAICGKQRNVPTVEGDVWEGHSHWLPLEDPSRAAERIASLISTPLAAHFRPRL